MKFSKASSKLRPLQAVVPMFVPAALALAAVGVLASFLSPFGTDKKTVWVEGFLNAFLPNTELTTAHEFAEVTSAKLVWLVTGAALTTVAVALGLVALLAARRIAVHICGQSNRAFVASTALIVLLGIATGATKDAQGHYWFEHIMSRAHEFGPMMGPHRVSLASPGETRSDTYGMKVGTFTTVANISIGFACMAVLTLAGTLLLRRSTADSGILAEQVRHLDLVPYLGAPVLILGVAEVFVLYRYVAFTVERTEDALLLARGVSSAVGITFSVLLAIAYLAPWIDLRSRVDALYRADMSKDPSLLAKRDEWLKEHGFSTSAWTGVGRILALLGPALTGTLIEQGPGIFQ